MAETIVVRQNQDFETQFLAAVDLEPPAEAPQPITHIHSLTPYGMMLASLGACTAIVLHTYAQNHQVDLRQVEIRLDYARHFQEDCDNCEEIERYEESITEQISLHGDLTERERQKLLRIAHHCPIYKMYRDGIQIHSNLTPPR